ncbi:MAG: 50S ribosomal protein L18 [Methanobacterium paludis]|uniref:Large ribosomal subunit protein uL18 n=1 Tax=Methanobacterium paludis (strain DSM 25820 / JCM 18151 / SWAN1) TaxID=868131 RepID=F6D7J8_METPW|nr:50S ribosomal protein L18 [Methanobacterium paludis]AEG18465.1 ribosomal protein L18P/L5E [Methanobacterium paludis]MCE7699403.1 50S ribosomal protein L18 [Methanobacterium paludis]
MAQGSRYKLAFKRRRDGKTDYKARSKLVGLDKSRLVVRITNNHTIVQIINVTQDGDETVVSAHTNELKKQGWLGSGKNTSAAYLTGFLCGKKALEAGVDEAVLDIGLKSSTKGARVFAALKGAVDSGLYVPHGDAILPADERIRGEHVAAYAESLSDEEVKQRFSKYIKNGLSPKDLPNHFETIKQKIEEGVS